MSRISGPLVESALLLLGRRLRDRGYDEPDVAMLLQQWRGLYGRMDERELSRRYLTELRPWEITGPH